MSKSKNTEKEEEAVKSYLSVPEILYHYIVLSTE